MPLSRRRKRILVAALSLCLLPFLVLGLGESYVRWRHPAYGDLWGAIRSHPRWVRELRPEQQGVMRALTGEYSHHYAINAQGLRQAEEVGSKDPARKRVLVLGDSFTFGLGVEDAEVWVRSLASAGLEPVNAGWASGYSPDTACLFLEERGIGFEPDLVIHQLTPQNDLLDLAQRNTWQVDDQKRLLAIQHRYHAVPDFLQAMAFPRFLMLQVLPAWRAKGSQGGGGGGASHGLSELERRGLARLKQMLSREQAFLAERKIPLLLVAIPAPQMPSHAAYAKWVAPRLEAIHGVATELKLPLFDPTGSPELGGAQEPLFYPRDGHFTPRGHELFGRFVAHRLAKGD